MQVNSFVFVLESGQTSGTKLEGTRFTPKQVVIYNSSPATLYFSQGNQSQQPKNAKSVPANTYIAFPFTQNVQSFTLFWESSTALSKTYEIEVEYSDTPLPFNFGALSQEVQFAPGQTVTISGDVTIQPAAGASFNIGTVSGTVTVSPASGSVFATSVSGTVNVQGVSGGTAVGVQVTNDLTISTVSGTVTVAPASGSTFATSVSGTVNVQGVSGGTAIGVQVTNDLTITAVNGTVTVQFPSAQEITWTTTGPVDIQNIILNNTDLVLLSAYEVTTANWAQNASGTFFGDGGIPSFATFSSWIQKPNQVGYYDGVVMVVISMDSAIQYTWGTTANAFLSPNNSTWFNQSAKSNEVNSFTVASPVTATQGTTAMGSSTSFFPNGVGCNIASINLTNPSTSTSDKLAIYWFGIKGQVSNPTASPAQMQPALGEFGAQLNTGTGAYILTALDTDLTLVASGTPAYIKTIKITAINDTGGAAVQIQVKFGTSIIGYYNLTAQYANGSSVSIDFFFPDGVAFNEDIIVEAIGASGGTTAIAVSFTAIVEGVDTAAQIVPTTT